MAGKAACPQGLTRGGPGAGDELAVTAEATLVTDPVRVGFRCHVHMGEDAAGVDSFRRGNRLSYERAILLVDVRQLLSIVAVYLLDAGDRLLVVILSHPLAYRSKSLHDLLFDERNVWLDAPLEHRLVHLAFQRLELVSGAVVAVDAVHEALFVLYALLGYLAPLVGQDVLVHRAIGPRHSNPADLGTALI